MSVEEIKKALEGDMNTGLTAIDRLRFIVGGVPDFDPITVEDADWIISALESLQRENEELRQRQLAWRSMDSAPKDGKHCILSIPSGGFVYTVQGAFMGGKWINALNVDAEPLAWMPNVLLPDAYCPWKRPFSVPLASTGGEHHGN